MHVLPFNWQQAHLSTQIETSLRTIAGWCVFFYSFNFLFIAMALFSAPNTHMRFASFLLFSFFTPLSFTPLIQLKECCNRRRSRHRSLTCFGARVCVSVQFNHLLIELRVLICISYASINVRIERCRMNPCMQVKCTVEYVLCIQQQQRWLACSSESVCLRAICIGSMFHWL